MLCFIISSSLIAQNLNVVKYELQSPNKKDELIVFKYEVGFNYAYHKN